MASRLDNPSSPELAQLAAFPGDAGGARTPWVSFLSLRPALLKIKHRF
jgi:hypothetical protein